MLRKPAEVFFRGTGGLYEGLFDLVDFGDEANQFLRECGVKDEPTPTELAEILSRAPQQVGALGLAVPHLFCSWLAWVVFALQQPVPF